MLGFQEIMEMKKKNLTKIITEKTLEVENAWKNTMKNVFKNKFEFVFSQNMLGLFIMIFIKPNLK